MFKIDTIFSVDKTKNITDNKRNFIIAMHKSTFCNVCSTVSCERIEQHYYKL